MDGGGIDVVKANWAMSTDVSDAKTNVVERSSQGKLWIHSFQPLASVSDQRIANAVPIDRTVDGQPPREFAPPKYHRPHIEMSHHQLFIVDGSEPLLAAFRSVESAWPGGLVLADRQDVGPLAHAAPQALVWLRCSRVELPMYCELLRDASRSSGRVRCWVWGVDRWDAAGEGLVRELGAEFWAVSPTPAELRDQLARESRRSIPEHRRPTPANDGVDRIWSTLPWPEAASRATGETPAKE